MVFVDLAFAEQPPHESDTSTMNTHSTVEQLKHAASQATHSAEHAAQSTASTVTDTLHKLTSAMHELQSMSIDGALARVGLTRRSNAVGAAVSFSSGFAIGAVSGLLLAPMSGALLRQKIWSRVRSTFSSGKSETIPSSPSVNGADSHVSPDSQHATALSRLSDDGGRQHSSISDGHKPAVTDGMRSTPIKL